MFDEKPDEAISNPFGEDTNAIKEENLTEENTVEENQKEQPVAQNSNNLQEELDDLNNKYLRLMADFDNYRKRQTQERENLLKYGACETLKKIIEVLDTTERAKKSIADLNDPETIKENYDIVFKQLFAALEKCGLEKIETDNKEFDPNLHEAVMQTPSSEHPEHTIISTAQTGYKLGELVLRPALVNVATVAEENGEEK